MKRGSRYWRNFGSPGTSCCQPAGRSSTLKVIKRGHSCNIARCIIVGLTHRKKDYQNPSRNGENNKVFISRVQYSKQSGSRTTPLSLISHSGPVCDVISAQHYTNPYPPVSEKLKHYIHIRSISNNTILAKCIILYIETNIIMLS